KFGTLFHDTDPDDSDSKIDASMKHNNKKLGTLKKHTIQNKKRSKTSKFGSQLQKVKNSKSYLDLEPTKRGLSAKYKI
ncbi:21141_t:CDS:2, partial [Gigaspora rosea]